MAIIKNENDGILQAASYRFINPDLTLSISDPALFTKPADSATLTPAQIVFTSARTLAGIVTGFATPTSYTWQYSTSSNPTTWVGLGASYNTATLTLANTLYQTHVGTTNTWVQYRVVYNYATEDSNTSDPITINYTIQTNSFPVIELSKESVFLPTITNNSVDTVTYTGSAFDINVKVGGVYFTYDATNSAAKTFSVGTPTVVSGTVILGAKTTADRNKDANAGTTAVDTAVFADVVSLSTETAILNYPVTIKVADGTVSTLYIQQQIVKARSGINGTRTATLNLYQWSASAPTAYPVGSSTYTWSTTQFTDPATLNSWSQTPGSGSVGQTLYSIGQVFTDNTTNTTSLVTWSANTIKVVGVYGATGPTGPTGPKSITISAFKWGTSVGTYSQAFTYTWSGSTVSAYPSGWTASAGAATATGQTLYQINLIITDTALVLTTAANWANAVVNTVGYRQDGSIGPTGSSARTAFIVNTSSTVPTSPTAVVGDAAPTGWSFTATSTLTAGQYMYQVDGILSAITGNITWGNPYLSNLKVGSLSAIAADLGIVQISTTGSLSTAGKTYGAATAGIFLGYSSTAYKMDIGSSTAYLRWDGSALTFSGALSGATGTFSGSLSAATGTFAGSLSAATGTFSGTLSAGAITSSSTIDVSGYISATGTTTKSDTQGFTGGSVITGSSATASAVSVFGIASGTAGIGVRGSSVSGHGVVGETSSASSYGIFGTGPSGGSGVVGTTGGLGAGQGVFGIAGSGTGVYGRSNSTGTGTRGEANGGYGIYGTATTGTGVQGESTSAGIGVNAISTAAGYSLKTSVARTIHDCSYTVASTATYSHDFIASGAYAIAMRVTSSGASSGAAQFFNTNSSKQFWTAPGGYAAYSPAGGGKIYVIDGQGPFTGVHDTLVPVNTVYEVGDIMVDYNLFYKLNVTNTLFEVRTSSVSNQKGVIGIYASTSNIQPGVPAIIWEPIASTITDENGVISSSTNLELLKQFDLNTLNSQYKVCNVNALGEGQLNVCGEGGNIAAGDLIVTSSTPGKGMRQADDLVHTYTVAKAREAVTFSSPNEIKQIACIYLCG